MLRQALRRNIDSTLETRLCVRMSLNIILLFGFDHAKPV